MKALFPLALLLASIPPEVISVDPLLGHVPIISGEIVGSDKWSKGVMSESGRQAGAITLDPVSIISLLALGAFLINNILQLLKTNQLMNHSGRSLEVADLDLPLELSDTETTGHKNLHKEDDPKKFTVGNFLGSVGSLYFVSPEKRSACMTKIFLCSQDEVSSVLRKRFGGSESILFDFLLSIVTRIVSPQSMRGNTHRPCYNLNQICSDGVLKEAEVRTHTKMYNLLSTYAVQRLISG